MSFLYVTIAAIAVVSLGLVLRYYGPRLKNPPIYGPPGPRPRELFVAEAGNNAISVYAIDERGLLQSPALRRIVDDPAQNPVTHLVAPYDIFVDTTYTFVLNNGTDAEGAVVPEVDAIVIFGNDKNGAAPPDYSWYQVTFEPILFSCLTVTRAQPDSLLLGVNFPDPLVMQLQKFPLQPNDQGQAGSLTNSRFGIISGIAASESSFYVLTQPAPGNQPGTQPTALPNGPMLLFFESSPRFMNAGEVAATRTIAGPNTLMSQPQRITVDRNGFVYVTNWGNGEFTGSVTVYDPMADGDVLPVRRIGGPDSRQTRLGRPLGIAVSDDGFIFVADTDLIKVFRPDDNGDVVPYQVLDVGDGSNVTGLAFHIPQ